jgi:adenylate cyclase
VRDTADALAIAERFGDDPALFVALEARGIVLVHQDGPQREHGFDLLAQVREAGLQKRISIMVVPVVDIQIAKERLRTGVSTLRSNCPGQSSMTCSLGAR